MKPIRKSYTIVATTTGAICASQTPAGAGALTLNGSLISGGLLTLSTPQHVRISCAGADAARTFIVSGTDDYGNSITESIVGSNAGTTAGTKNFKTVTGVSVDAATVGAVTVDVLGTLETSWIKLNYLQSPFNVGYHVDVGTATFTVEGTMSDLTDEPNNATSFTVQASGSSDVAGNTVTPMTGLRIKVTAFTSGTVNLNVIQP